MAIRPIHDDHEVVVDSVVEVASGVRTLLLRPVTGASLPPWTPGSHVDVMLPSGTVRQYSLCGRPDADDEYRIGVLCAPQSRGGSEEVHALEVGAKIRIGPPRNQFPLLPSPRYLFIAGGIGITPILPMIAAAEVAGAEWELVYGGRGRSSMAFLDELSQRADRVTLVPQDECGLIDLPGLLSEPCDDTLIYACGPGALLDAVAEHVRQWPDGSLHTERFSQEAEARSDDHSFEVVLERSGTRHVVPADRSILGTLQDAGVDVAFSCTQGMCGTCEQTVIQGVPDHRDAVLTPEERETGEYILICVSRCQGSRLVLDM